jgi:hypothetical protein
MRPALPYVLIAVLSGAVVALLGSRRDAPPDAASGGAPDLKAALVDVERSLASIEKSLGDGGPRLARAAAAPASAPEGLPPAAAPGQPPPSRAPTGEAPPISIDRVAGPILPASDPERLGQLDGWAKVPDVRRRWLFLDERGVVEAFGIPDAVQGRSGEGENWVYASEDRHVTLWISRGRLVEVYGARER